MTGLLFEPTPSDERAGETDTALMYQPQLFGGEHVETGEATSDWWCTPESALGAPMFGLAHVRAFYTPEAGDDRPIDLDPCSNVRSTVGARLTYTLADDGLSQSWAPLRKWVNPPYSNCGPWLARCQSSTAGQGRMGRSEALALVKGDWSTSWWQDYVRTATARCELSTRVRFVVPEGANGSPPWPSVLVYWGPRVERFARMFGDIGEVIGGTEVPSPCESCGGTGKPAKPEEWAGEVCGDCGGTGRDPNGDIPSAPGYQP